MEEKLEQWRNEYNLKNLQIAGYRGGYPIIQFDKENSLHLLRMSEKDRKKVIRKAEIYGGIQLGVAYNFVNSAFIIVNEETVVICGHEFVIDRILEKIV